MLKKQIDVLLKELLDNPEIYEKHTPILEFLDDEGLDRRFYEKLDPNELIHEHVRYNTSCGSKIGELGFWIVCGIMECYDFCRNNPELPIEEGYGRRSEWHYK